MEIKKMSLTSPALAAFLSALICYVLIYGFELTHFTLSIDEEFNNNIMHTISMGRWGHALLKFTILPEPFIPFFTSVLSMSILSASSSFLAKAMRLSVKDAVFFSILYSSFSQFSYQLQFLNQADTYAISVLLCSIASYMLLRTEGIIYSFILPTVMLVMAISIYQSIIFLPYSIVLACLLKDIFLEDNNYNKTRILIKLVITSMAALITYSVITRVVQNHFNVHSDSYFTNMIGWLNLPFKESFLQTSSFITNYLTFHAPVGLTIYPLSLLVFLIIPTATLKKKSQLTLFSILLLLSPFIMNILIGAGLPARAMTSMAIVFASSLSLLFMVKNRHNVLWCIPLLSLIYGVASSSTLFYADYQSYQKDYRLSSAIAEDIRKELGVNLEKPTRVYFYGALEVNQEMKPLNSDMFGSSFLNWDGGNSARISAFFNVTGIGKIVPTSYQYVSANASKIESAPTWPSKGSIFFLNDIVFVKLGNKPGNCVNGIYKSIDPTRCL